MVDERPSRSRASDTSLRPDGLGDQLTFQSGSEAASPPRDTNQARSAATFTPSELGRGVSRHGNGPLTKLNACSGPAFRRARGPVRCRSNTDETTLRVARLAAGQVVLRVARAVL